MPDADRLNDTRRDRTPPAGLAARRLPWLEAGFFPLLLLLAVYGYALSLLLGAGTYKPALYLSAAGVAGMLGVHRGAGLLRPAWVAIGLALALLAHGCLMAGDRLWGVYHAALPWFAVAVAAVVLVPDRFGPERLDHGALLGFLTALAVGAQIVALGARVNRAGLFSNIHYLSQFTILTLPLLLYWALRGPSVLRGLMWLAIVGDFWLLLKTQSRPGFLALLAGGLATAPFLAPRARWAALAAVALVPGSLYATDLLGFAARIDDFAAHFRTDERVVMWREAWGLLAENTPREWWLGHGFGQFYWDYQAVSSFSPMENFAFPHNFVFEVLYSHGIVGLLPVVVAYGLFYRHLAAATRASHTASRRLAGALVIGAFTAVLVHGFLTLPLISRHHLYPLSLVLGAGFRFLRAGDPAHG